MSTGKYLVSSTAWSVAAKLIDAIVRLATVPILLSVFGKSGFGILSLSIASNALVMLLDLGLNTGLIKNVSELISQKEKDKLNKIVKASLTIYITIGIINALILIIIAYNSQSIFNVSHQESILLYKLLLITSLFAIPSWFTVLANQILIAARQTALVQKINVAKVIAVLILTMAMGFVEIGVTLYLILSLVIAQIAAIYLVYIVITKDLVDSYRPSLNLKPVIPILKYSSTIFLLGIFQFAAIYSRPVVLGMYSESASIIVADYRVMEVFPAFIISIGSVMISILLPIVTEALSLNNSRRLFIVAKYGTHYLTVAICAMSIPVIVFARIILINYVGIEYSHLWAWLSAWVFITVLAQHINPISSILLAKGKLKPLLYSSLLSSVLSIILNAKLVTYYGAGSAILAYGFYIILQLLFYYYVFVPRILNINSASILSGVIKPIGVALIIIILSLLLTKSVESILVALLISLVLVLIFIVTLVPMKRLRLASRLVLTRLE